MGVFKRYKDAQAAQKDAENAMPGAYQSNYTDRIDEALDSMGAASNAGYDVGTDSELYRQYRAGAQANARAAAENAAAGAAALSGGYGSSYANSVAQQGYQQAMANVDSGLAGLRDKALTMYQLKQNGLSGLLSALQNQDSLEAAEHQGTVANAQDWRDYKKSRADQAAQEKSSFWSNLLDTVMNIGGALVNGYDAYKGFSRQKEQDKLSAITQAAQYRKEGASTDFLNSILEPYGLDASIFDDWDTGDTEEMSMSDMMGLLTQAAGVQDDGHPELAQYMLKVNNIDPSILGNYSAALYKNNNSGSSGSGRRSGSSGGSSGSGTKNSGSDTMKWSSNNVLSLKSSRDEKAKKGLDTSWEDALLAEIGYPVEPTNASQTNASQSGGVDMAAMLAKNYAKKGYSAWAIMNNMSQNGYSDDEIARALEKAGVKG